MPSRVKTPARREPVGVTECYRALAPSWSWLTFRLWKVKSARAVGQATTRRMLECVQLPDQRRKKGIRNNELKIKKGMWNWRNEWKVYCKVVDLDPVTSGITLNMSD